jgi:acetoacetate decarboxylase
MASIHDLKGFCYPLTPEGKSSIVGDMPWHYGTEYLNISYTADPKAIAAYLPEPLEPGPEPEAAYVAFSKWWSLWDNQLGMAAINPERTQYMEAAIWVGCSYKGEPGQICLQIWVDNDFTMARGWFMGFAKKLGSVAITSYNPLNPAMPEMAKGVKLKGIVSSHHDRLLEGSITLEKKIKKEGLPNPMGLPLFHIRHFPSIVKDAPPSVLELVKLGAENVKISKDIWMGEGALTFFPSELEEHMPLKPRKINRAYYFSSGYSFPGGEVLHSWV